MMKHRRKKVLLRVPVLILSIMLVMSISGVAAFAEEEQESVQDQMVQAEEDPAEEEGSDETVTEDAEPEDSEEKETAEEPEEEPEEPEEEPEEPEEEPEEPEAAVKPEAAEEPEPAEGEVILADENHVHDGIEFIPWNESDSLPAEAGSYYLTTDVTLDNTWTVPEKNTTNLCLNGHHIKADPDMWGDDSRLIQILDEEKTGSTVLNLYDCGTVEYHFDINSESGLAENIAPADGADDGQTFTGGYIYGSGKSVFGVAVVGGQFNMYGGTIIGNGYSGVYLLLYASSEFNLYGGNILGNVSELGGGVLISHGSFNMAGGRISYNTAIVKEDYGGYSYGGYGGGVKVETGYFTMSGGGISNNTAEKEGGGVSINAYQEIYKRSMTLTGGRIINNVSKSGAGGIEIRSENTFFVSGDPVVSGNQMIQNGSRETSNAVLNNMRITVNGVLEEGCSIGVRTVTKVTAENPFEFTDGYSFSGNTEDPSEYFTSDDPDCSVGLNTEGEAVLGKTYAVTNATPASSFGTITVPDAAPESAVVKITSLPEEGYVTKNIIVKDSNGNPVQTEGSGSTCTFIMPGSDVSVTAEFQKVIDPKVTVKGWKYGSYDQDKNAPVVTGNEGGGKESFVYYTDEKCKTKTTSKNSGAAGKGGVPVNAGTYWVKASVAETESYTGGTAVAGFTVSRAKLTVTANALSKKEGEKDPKLTYTAKGLVGSDKISGKLTRDAGEKPGKYAIKQGTLKASDNYDLVYKGAKFTIIDDPVNPARPDYTTLAKLTVSGQTALKLTWSSVKGAQGYDVFFSQCGANNVCKKVGSVKASDSLSYTFSGLKKNTAYKAYVKAWKKEGGVKTYIGKANPVVHAATGGSSGAYCNAKSITVNKTELTISKGKTASVKVRLQGTDPDKKIIEHNAAIRFRNSNKAVAAIDSTGRITALNEGTCRIYIIANNGVRTSVKVTVV